MTDQKINPAVRVTVPGKPELDHDVSLTGHRQANSAGVGYAEAVRGDNGLHEMIPVSWLEDTRPAVGVAAAAMAALEAGARPEWVAALLGAAIDELAGDDVAAAESVAAVLRGFVTERDRLQAAFEARAVGQSLREGGVRHLDGTPLTPAELADTSAVTVDALHAAEARAREAGR